MLYIDPGTGSLLFQMILSGLLTILVFFKRLTMFFRAFFTGKMAQLRFYRRDKQ